MLRSGDPMIYEDGYQWLQGAKLDQYIHEIVKLLRCEYDAVIRSKLVELVGNADKAEYIPLLVEQLSHDSPEVRLWAYSGLIYSEHELAKLHAARHRESHPNEEFY